MRGIPASFVFVFFVIVILIELITYYGIRIMSNNRSKSFRLYFTIIYTLFSILTTSLLLFAFANPEVIRNARNYSFFYLVISVAIMNLLPKLIFALITLLSFMIRWIGSLRMQQVLLAGSFIICTGLFGVIAYGMIGGRNHPNVERQDLYLNNWPKQLDGFTIVQLSDIHLGTFGNNVNLMDKTATIVNSLNPDLLLFTGDLVNNFGDEAKGFESSLTRLQGRYGKFAILGNHDYGDYSAWPDSISKATNLDQIKGSLTNNGFTLLLNEWESISVKDTSIFLIGVENWGHPPFPQYANLDQAMKGIPDNAFKILMSHDPAHWKAVIIPQTDIPLTLSGHTHGAQMGITMAGITFSPIFFIQKNWGGLYHSEGQYLYVNRGLGTIGFKGRIGMRPEITVLTLNRTKSH